MDAGIGFAGDSRQGEVEDSVAQAAPDSGGRCYHGNRRLDRQLPWIASFRFLFDCRANRRHIVFELPPARGSGHRHEEVPRGRSHRQTRR